MIDDFRTLEDGSLLQCDVCIVGAGAAGITIAFDLKASGLTVCLLESGGLDFDPAVQLLANAESAGLPMRAFEADRCITLDTGRARMFGGTTSVWSCLCIPLEPMDFQQRPWVPYSGWPLRLEDLQYWYLRAVKTLDLDASLFMDAISARTNELLPQIDQRTAQVILWQWAWIKRFGESFRSTLEQAESVHVVLHASAVRLCTNDSVSIIKHVEIRSMDGKAGRVEARAFVLAGGAIENARLLLVSNERCLNGLGNSHGVVGKFFMEHPRGSCGVVRWLDCSALDHRWLGGSERLRLGFGLGSEAQRKHEVGNCAVYFATNRPLIARDPTAATIYLWFDAEQVPNPNSRIFLSSERDALGINLCKVEWRLSQLDRKTIDTAATLLAAELHRAGLAQIQIDEWLDKREDGWTSNIHDIFHHMGTTRMADHPLRGVVSKDCQVFGLVNLFAAGSSVFPTGGHANPTFTIIALALRLSDHLQHILTEDKLPPIDKSNL